MCAHYLAWRSLTITAFTDGYESANRGAGCWISPCLELGLWPPPHYCSNYKGPHINPRDSSARIYEVHEYEGTAWNLSMSANLAPFSPLSLIFQSDWTQNNSSNIAIIFAYLILKTLTSLSCRQFCLNVWEKPVYFYTEVEARPRTDNQFFF